MLFWPAAALITALVLTRIERQRDASRRPERERGAPPSAVDSDAGRYTAASKPAEVRTAPSVGGSSPRSSDVLFDEQAVPEVRLGAFEERLRRGNPRDLADARRFLQETPASLQLQALIRLARAPIPPERRRALLEWAARHASASAAVLAVQLLGADGDAGASAVLGALLADRAVPSVVRAEAARVLGAVGDSVAFEALARSVATEPDETVFEGVVAGLARFPFQEVRPLFESLLTDSARPEALRASAIEALAESSDPAAAEFLSRYLADSAAAVREAAAWALAAFEGEEAPDVVVQRAATRLAREEAPDVRKHLYEFLAESADSRVVLEEVAERVAAEPDPGAQFAGWLALSFRANEYDFLQDRLLEEALPAASSAALDESAPPARRLQAVMILSQVGGADARSVLERLRQSVDPRVVRAAESALARMKQTAP